LFSFTQASYGKPARAYKFWDETGDFSLIMLVEAFFFLWLARPFKRQMEEKERINNHQKNEKIQPVSS
jgi:hypothetical protein